MQGISSEETAVQWTLLTSAGSCCECFMSLVASALLYAAVLEEQVEGG